MTLGDQWAFKPNDRIKSLEECVQTLVRCAGGDGNLLLNVGPMPTGAIEPRQAQRLREIGAWLARNGESIYGTRGGPFKPTKSYAATRKGNSIYVHVFAWNGDRVMLPPLDARIVATNVLGGGHARPRTPAPRASRSPCPQAITGRSIRWSVWISTALPSPWPRRYPEAWKKRSEKLARRADQGVFPPARFRGPSRSAQRACHVFRSGSGSLSSPAASRIPARSGSTFQ